MHHATIKSPVTACLVLLLAGARAPAAPTMAELRRAVVKIHVTAQQPDYSMPWQSESPGSGTGSGFVISGRRILSNAHVVSDARFLEVQREDDPRRFRAHVRFAAHDCDLATLEVDDPAFFEGTDSIELADALPELNDEVTVLGYPLGGTRLSITRGVVSRIDYSTYAHSGVDQHLVLQVDAAINPGNSGGPVLFNQRVVGLAFQGLSWAENIGYAIPLPVLRHFLDDIADGVYNGYPELGVAFLPLRNAALARDLGVETSGSGIAVTYVDPFGSGAPVVKTGDVILGIDGYGVADDGSIALDGHRVLFAELIERKQWGDAVVLNILRGGERHQLNVPLTHPPDPFVFRRQYDTQPPYVVRAGMVFSPLSRELLQAVLRSRSGSAEALAYYFEYAKIDGLYRDFHEFVVYTRRLPHPINAYTDRFLGCIVTHVNDRPVSRLADFKAGWDACDGEFQVLRFADEDDVLVIPAAAAAGSHEDLLANYGVPKADYLGETP